MREDKAFDVIDAQFLRKGWNDLFISIINVKLFLHGAEARWSLVDYWEIGNSNFQFKHFFRSLLVFPVFCLQQEKPLYCCKISGGAKVENDVIVLGGIYGHQINT